MQTRHTVTVGGDDLVAVHHEADTDRWMVFSHGFLSDKSGSYEGRCERAVTEGYQAVRFDHRGCGESDRAFGDQTLTTRLADLEAVLDYFDPGRCVLFGSSFGGRVALHTGVDGRVEAVAARAPLTVTDSSTFESYADETFLAAFERHPFEAVTRTLDVPVALFHGRDDDTVDPADSRVAAGALDTEVFLQLYAGEGHNFSRATESRLREQLFDWLAVTVGDRV